MSDRCPLGYLLNKRILVKNKGIGILPHMLKLIKIKGNFTEKKIMHFVLDD